MAKMLQACSKRKNFHPEDAIVPIYSSTRSSLSGYGFHIIDDTKKETASTFSNYTIPKSMSNDLKDVKNTHIAFIINVCDDFGTTKK